MAENVHRYANVIASVLDSYVCEDEIELDFRTLLYLCGNVE